MSEVHGIDGRLISAGDAPAPNAVLVDMLEKALADAKSGRLLAFAGVLCFFEDQRLNFKFATVSNDWPIHDRLLARVCALRAFMEKDLLDKMEAIDPPIAEPPPEAS